jgi:3-oxoacyl-[acyl-carrier protein] reductase
MDWADEVELTRPSAMPPEALTGMDGYIQATPAAPRVGTVDDVTQIVAFLCEEGARWVTGSTTCANGGAEFV